MWKEVKVLSTILAQDIFMYALRNFNRLGNISYEHYRIFYVYNIPILDNQIIWRIFKSSLYSLCNMRMCQNEQMILYHKDIWQRWSFLTWEVQLQLQFWLYASTIKDTLSYCSLSSGRSKDSSPYSKLDIFCNFAFVISTF